MSDKRKILEVDRDYCAALFVVVRMIRCAKLIFDLKRRRTYSPAVQQAVQCMYNTGPYVKIRQRVYFMCYKCGAYDVVCLLFDYRTFTVE